MPKQSFFDFKYQYARDNAIDDANDYHAKDFIVQVLTDHYLEDIPNNKKDFRNYLLEKGYGEDEVNEELEDVEDSLVLEFIDTFENKVYQLPSDHFDKFNKKFNHISDEQIEYEFKTFGWEQENENE
jgi:hypothetical protein